ncbi:DUF1761 domain-containing protein [Ekhidna sp.]|uniref:DUF1761 domain-containing protein n=1 Tax=Ekhidna sp. TaxID=2608089 RepID=UPI003299A553
MDLATALENINWVSVLIAAISSFLIGGVWYGPLFGRQWMNAFGFTEEELKKRSIFKTFGLSFLLALFAAFILEMFIGPEADLIFGTMAGLFAGLGWVATFLGILYLFEMQTMKVYLINAGYCVISLTIMGLILGNW